MFAFFTAAAQSGNLEEDNSPKDDRPPLAPIGRCGTSCGRLGAGSPEPTGLSSWMWRGTQFGYYTDMLFRYFGSSFLDIVRVTCDFVNKVLFCVASMENTYEKNATRSRVVYTVGDCKL